MICISGFVTAVTLALTRNPIGQTFDRIEFRKDAMHVFSVLVNQGNLPQSN